MLPPQDYIGAVEAIPEVVELIAKLLGRGAAYRVDDEQYPDVYFDHSATGRFGYESNLRRADHAVDCSPSAAATPSGRASGTRWTRCCGGPPAPDEPSWDDRSRPRAGPAGTSSARDRAEPAGQRASTCRAAAPTWSFPHHEFSAAHAEALTGDYPFARHYTHAGMIGLDGEKMSKSRGNLVFVSRLRADGVDPMAVRLGLLAGHYRTDRSWTDDAARHRPDQAGPLAQRGARPDRPGRRRHVARLRDHLADDLDTPNALAAVDAWVAEALTGPAPTRTRPASCGWRWTHYWVSRSDLRRSSTDGVPATSSPAGTRNDASGLAW